MSYNKETNEYEGYIYLITNLINNKKYVGQTITTIEHRKNQHFSKQKDPHVKALYNAIQKYGKDNFSVEEICKVSNSVKENMQKELDEKEIYYIKKHNSLCSQHGYNMDKGGSRKNNLEMPLVVYDIHGNFLENCCSAMEASEKYGLSDATIRLICKGKQPNYKQQLVFRYVGDSFDKFAVVSSKFKFIYQFEPNGKFVRKYDMVVKAEEKIGQCINREAIDDPHLLSGGYWWSYNEVFNYQGSAIKKMVDVYDDVGNFIATYESIAETSRITGVSIDAISDCCNGKAKIRKGYMFCYHGEDLSKNTYVPTSTYNKKAVNQYNKKDEYIMTFGSTVEATRTFTNSKSNAILYCCRHRKHYNTAFGYKWFYADDPEQPDKSKIISTIK